MPNSNMPNLHKNKIHKNTKITLFEKLINDGWFGTAEEALPWIISGKVLAGDQQVLSGKAKIRADSAIRIKEYYKRKYVNKGGLKLQKALADFHVAAEGKTALDCGASTGGFTDCLLQHGADLVYAVDAGCGELAGKLLINEKVVNMERTNISDGSLTRLSPKPELITLDLSYLSLKKALPACKAIAVPGADIVALIKPIVETESAEAKRSGDVNRREIIVEVLIGLCGFFAENGFNLEGLTYSPIRGNNGALEYFAHLRFGGADKNGTNGGKATADKADVARGGADADDADDASGAATADDADVASSTATADEADVARGGATADDSDAINCAADGKSANPVDISAELRRRIFEIVDESFQLAKFDKNNISSI